MFSVAGRCLGGLSPRESKSRHFLTMLVIVTWTCSTLSVSESHPNGLQRGSEWREPERLVSQRGEGEGEEEEREKDGVPHRLSRRVASMMVPIRERETTSLCAYEVTTDVNLQRIPDKIDRVVCLKDSCKCVEQGNYRCTQLYTQLNVTYLTLDWKPNFEFELIDVEYACVCSRALEGSNVNLLEPVLV